LDDYDERWELKEVGRTQNREKKYEMKEKKKPQTWKPRRHEETKIKQKRQNTF